MNKKHHIAPVELAKLVVAVENIGSDKNEVTMADIVMNNMRRAEEFSGGQVHLVALDGKRYEDDPETFGHSFLQALDRAGFVIVKKAPALPNPRDNYRSDYVI